MSIVSSIKSRARHLWALFASEAGKTASPVAGSSAPESGNVDNPFLDSRRAWNDHVGHLVAGRTIWQAVGLVGLLIGLAAVGGFLHLASRPQYVPYVIEVDQTGNVQAARPAAERATATRPMVETQLRNFITLSRRVTTDMAMQRAAIFGVFTMLSPDDPATTKLRSHFGPKDAPEFPFNRAKAVTVTTEIRSTLQQSGDTWQVDWTESVYERSGQVKRRFAMRALVEIYQSDPKRTTKRALEENPLGIYVRNFSWNEHATKEVHL